jgi:dUTPase
MYNGSIFGQKFEYIYCYSLSMAYRLELLVTEAGAPFYPKVGTVEYLTKENAGYDVRVVENVTPNTEARLVPLGIKARMLRFDDDGSGVSVGVDSHFTLEPRSSIYRSGFMMANGRGVIDMSYRGELMAPLVSVGTVFKSVEAGTRLFQILAPGMGYIHEVVYVDSLPTTVRGEGGFGSTGTK